MADHVATAPSSVSRPSVRLLGEYVVPANLQFEGTTVGGLSGIDYDPRSGNYLLISDDRSKIDPARFYTAEIALSEAGIKDVTFTSVTFLRRPDGETYPSVDEWAAVQDGYSASDRNRLGPVDPEEIRIDPRTGNVLWSQEGVPAESSTGIPVLVDPAVRISARDGAFIGQLPLPKKLRYSDATGPRPDHGIESLTYAADGELIVSVLEDPIKADGAEPTARSGGLTRLTVQARDGSVVGQYAYELDPLPGGGDAAKAAGGNTGAASILAVHPSTSIDFLVLERAWAPALGNRVRIYRADISGATDVQSMSSLAQGGIEPARRTLFVDLAEVGLPLLQNSESMTWGPDLPTGERTLLVISDDNFTGAAGKQTQLVALAVDER